LVKKILFSKLFKNIIAIFKARMKACLRQKTSIPTQKQYTPVSQTNHTIENLPRPYYNTIHTQQIQMNFPQQTQFINRNVK
jgi:hypothetical protein